MKQTFNIPSGCTSVTVEQVGNQIITSFEHEKYIPKRGDCVKRISGSGEHYIGEYDGDSELYNCIDLSENRIKKRIHMLIENGSFQKLTPEEFQAEFAKLGYVYDFETHTASKIKWRAKQGEKYFYVSSRFGVNSDTEDFHSFDDDRYKTGNYFNTELKAKEAAEFLKQQLKQFINNKK